MTPRIIRTIPSIFSCGIVSPSHQQIKSHDGDDDSADDGTDVNRYRIVVQGLKKRWKCHDVHSAINCDKYPYKNHGKAYDFLFHKLI